MIPELLPVWSRWRETHAALLDWLEQFPEERLPWTPGGTAPSAAGILVHTAVAEAFYAHRIAPAASLPAGFAFVSDSAEARAARRRELTARLERTVEARALVQGAADFAGGVVAELSAADLERVVATEWNPLGPRVRGDLNSGWFIEQMTRHKAYHLGQLWLLSMLLEEAPE